MRILGLDTGLKTGWCIYDSDTKQVIESGVQDFSKKRGESNGLMFLRFRKWLKYLLNIQVDLVGYERAHFRGGAATEIGVGLQTRVQEECAGHDPVIEAAPVHSGTLKKWACGHGKASKADMALKASRLVLGKIIDDNEADAILIATWTAEEYG